MQHIILENKFDTFSSYMQRALYGRFGYYTAGTVEIGGESNTSGSDQLDQILNMLGVTQPPVQSNFHYTTHATKGRGLAFVLVNYFHRMFEEQIKSNRSLNDATPFIVVELSGGQGELAYQILNYLKKLSEAKIKYYPELYKVIQYTTYEISPALAKIQVDKNEEFIKNKKYNIKNVSAAEINETSIDVCFSNEFWDALPFDDIKKDAMGNIFIKVCIAHTKENAFTADNENLLSLKKVIGSDEMPHGTILDLTALENKYQQCNNKTEWFDFLNKINWKPVWVPLSCYPTIEKTFKTIKPYIDELDSDIEHHLSADLITIATKLSNINPYYSMHFDYAGAAKGGSRFPVRYYPRRGNKNNIFNFQVNVDITTEVDFRLLAFILSSQTMLNCIYNYNALACVIQDELTEPFIFLYRNQHILKDDIRIFCETNANFKFLSHSNCVNLRKLCADIDIDIDIDIYFVEEDFPDKPLKPINAGIPLDRPYHPQPNMPGCLLNPKSDMVRVSQFNEKFIDTLRGTLSLDDIFIQKKYTSLAGCFSGLFFNCRSASINYLKYIKTADDVISVAKVNSSADRLIELKLDLIAPLFETAEQVIELAKVNSSAAYRLIELKLDLIAPLFKTAEQVIELAKVADVAYPLKKYQENQTIEQATKKMKK